MIKTKSAILIIILIIFSTQSQAQNWQWARHFGGWGSDFVTGMCSDASGNIYTTGYFTSYFGVFGADTINTNSMNDIFIVKMDSNGNFIWSKRAGGSGTPNVNEGYDIVYENTSNTIITAGKMTGTNETIGSCNLGTGTKIYLSKLDLSGNCIWSVSQGNGADCYGIYLTLDNNGYIYMNGYISNSAFFNGTIPIQAGSFIAKFNSSNGALIWAKNVLDTYGDLYKMIYKDNAIYMCGNTINTTTPDTLHLDTAVAYCYKVDVFLSKWDTAGNVLWVKTMGGPNNDWAGYMSMDGSDNIYLNGEFQDTAYFGATTLSNGTNKDWFLAKFNSQGNLKWIRQGHATSTTYAGAVSSDNDGNTYFSGIFSDTLHFGAYTMVAATAQDMFVARYDSSGVCLGVKTVGNASPASIITNSTGGFYVSGSFNPTANFEGNNLTSYGNADAFVAKCDAITGVNSKIFNKNNTLNIYANPNKGTCNITVPDDLLHEDNLVLNIYDTNGKLIQQLPVTINEEKIKINLQEEATGVYNVTLGNSKKMYSGKIVFE